jgi:hypothetical protein
MASPSRRNGSNKRGREEPINMPGEALTFTNEDEAPSVANTATNTSSANKKRSSASKRKKFM